MRSVGRASVDQGYKKKERERERKTVGSWGLTRGRQIKIALIVTVSVVIVHLVLMNRLCVELVWTGAPDLVLDGARLPTSGSHGLARYLVATRFGEGAPTAAPRLLN